MNHTDTDRLVEAYLRRLETTAAALPADERDELVADIREHIDAALAQEGRDEATVRTVLDRLGPPEDIVASASAGSPAGAAPTDVRGSTGLAVGALAVLALGSLLVPVVNVLVGVPLVVASRAWTPRDKVVGLSAPVVLGLAGLLVGGVASMGLGPFELALLLVALGGPIAAVVLAVLLVVRRPFAARRARSRTSFAAREQR